MTSDTAERLALVWQDVLGLPPSPELDFFTAGGDSLQLVQLINDAAAAGIVLSLDDVFDGATFSELAAKAVDEAEALSPADLEVEQLWSGLRRDAEPVAPLVTFDTAGSGGEPLFVLPWGTGSVAFLRPFVRDATVEVHGVEAVGLHDGHVPLSDIDAMARAAARAVIAHGAPRVHLGGFCLGAAIALNAAGYIQDAGVSIASLSLVDLSPRDEDDPALDWTIGQHFTYHVGMNRHDLGASDAAIMEGLALKGNVDEGDGADRFLHIQSVWAANSFAGLRWRPAAFAGRTHLLRSRSSSSAGPQVWDHPLGSAEVTDVFFEDAPNTRMLLADPSFAAAFWANLRSDRHAVT